MSAIVLLVAFGVGFASMNEPFEPTPLRILPLGDSITQAGGRYHGYRYYLWTKLIDAGIDADFIGRNHSGAGDDPVMPRYKGILFDTDNEGHSGYRADQIFSMLQSEEMTRWLVENAPDVILVHLGTNDALQGQRADNTAKELKQIIRILQTISPGATIMLAKIIPIADETANGRVEKLNARMTEIAAETTTTRSKVIVVDQYTGFDANDDTYDGVHPNKQGKMKMAEKWFDALQSVTEKKSRRRLAGI